jgi:hypothetical protein
MKKRRNKPDVDDDSFSFEEYLEVQKMETKGVSFSREVKTIDQLKVLAKNRTLTVNVARLQEKVFEETAYANAEQLAANPKSDEFWNHRVLTDIPKDYIDQKLVHVSYTYLILL